MQQVFIIIAQNQLTVTQQALFVNETTALALTFIDFTLIAMLA